MKISPKVLLADDHAVVRQGMSIMLRKAFKDVQVFQAENMTEILYKVKQDMYDLLVLDVYFPEGSSIGIITQIKEIQPQCKILIFSGYSEEQYALRYINSGADGFLNKLSSETDVYQAVTTVLKNKKYVSTTVKDKILDSVLNNHVQNPLDTLSNRELEVARLLVNGEGNLEISNILNLQKSTVSTYKYRIFEKLQISNVVSLVSLFREYNKTI
ncbi:response regulator transcription factor [Galbibacter sp. EGI 63066]|uniref:response regulator transcription factor n=1 Tax=Galbibacter sp. EGI 63066 TaxID=2993559 RepID=UPI00224908B4|nr:response regulator transcription factor [Galbibacter sp. EGI 63066]MCX2678692.1 response regulator transcription factor [Galbibacter sp. EGI 63066]